MMSVQTTNTAPEERPKRPRWPLRGPTPPPGPVQPASDRFRACKARLWPQSRAASLHDACDTVARPPGPPRGRRTCRRGRPARSVHTMDASARGGGLSCALHAAAAPGNGRYIRYGRSTATGAGMLGALRRWRDDIATCGSEANKDE